MKRPFGVTVIAVLALISGLFGLCLPVLVFMGSTLLGPLAVVGVAAGIFLIIGPVLQLVFSYGAFNLRSWAWYLGLISSGITVLGVIINLFNGASFWTAVWGSILPIVIFIYLLTPNVRQSFGKGPQLPAQAMTPQTEQQVEPMQPQSQTDSEQQ